MEGFPRSPLAPKALLGQGELAQRRKQWQAALGHYRLLLQRYPRSAERHPAAFQLAWVLWQLDRHAQATEHMAQVARSAPTPLNLQAAVQLTLWSRKLGRWDQTQSWAQFVINAPHATAEQKWQVSYAIGAWAVEKQQWERALQWMQQALGVAPADQAAEVRFWVAESAFQLGKYRQCVDQVRKLQEQLPSPAPPWAATAQLRLAQSLLELGELRSALLAAQQGLKRWPEFSRAYMWHWVVAVAFMRQGEFAQARKAFQQVINHPRSSGTPRAAMAQWMIGETYLHQRQYRQALRQYLRVELLYPYPKWQAAALLQAGKCYEKLGEVDKAAQLYLRIVNHLADSPFRAQAHQRLQALGGRGQVQR